MVVVLLLVEVMMVEVLAKERSTLIIDRSRRRMQVTYSSSARMLTRQARRLELAMRKHNACVQVQCDGSRGILLREPERQWFEVATIAIAKA